MIGQGSPRTWRLRHLFLAVCLEKVCVQYWCALLIVISCLLSGTQLKAEDKIARIRFAWGNSSSTKMRWNGQIKFEGGKLSDLQPLGVESDAPVSLQIDNDHVVVVPRVKRGFEGCDITVHADSAALVSIELQAEQAPHMTRIRVPLSDIIDGEVRQPIDELGSYVVAHRAPGDKLRVQSQREHYVFNTNEVWKLKILPDLQKELSTGPIQVVAQLSSIGGNVVLWSDKKQIQSDFEPDSLIPFEIPCPAEENAYRLTLFAHHEEGFATRFVPGAQVKFLAQRNINIVVIDPGKKLPIPSDQWKPVLTIDPANPHWWQRLPAWARVPGLRERMQGSIGNVEPLLRNSKQGELVELPLADGLNDPPWQSYTLPVQETGVMHLLEIEYPQDREQHLSVCVVEPDAAGRVLKDNLDSGFYAVDSDLNKSDQRAVHQFVFWPRTNTPQLLIVNQHSKAPAQFGKIRLFRQPANNLQFRDEQNSERIVAAYIAEPNFASNFGAEEVLDQASGLSVQGWSTFLQGANRLIQYLRYNGQNTVMLSVAADGSSLYPSAIINPSPRFDTGSLAADGQDPRRKDILEMLLRICDREGIQVIPTVELSSPLPQLEQLVQAYDTHSAGFVTIGSDGERFPSQFAGPQILAQYNLLNPRVQQEIEAMMIELVHRYGQHPSLRGAGIQLSSDGYGVLPGLDSGFDDATVSQFVQETGLKFSASGDQRFAERAKILLGEKRATWMQWRMKSVSEFYKKLAKKLQASRDDMQLYLTTESLFEAQQVAQKLRQSFSNTSSLQEILVEFGIDLVQLQSYPGIKTIQAMRMNSNPDLQHYALDLRINSACLRGELNSRLQADTLLQYHSSDAFNLSSFDKLSPFGAEKTFLKVGGSTTPAGYTQRKLFISQLARGEIEELFLGGNNVSLASNEKTRRILKAIQKLPAPDNLVRTHEKQPLVTRIYRTDSETTVVLINESPWPLELSLPLEAAQQYAWEQLGATRESGTGYGFFAPGQRDLKVNLEPFDLQAWRFDSSKVRINEPRMYPSNIAKQQLLARIEEIESRTANLDIERPYPQLQNPGFELLDGTTRIVGWQPQLGSYGNVRLSNSDTHQGGYALTLSSKDQNGVMIQSNLFPMPETGQLMVSAHLRADSWNQEARLLISIEDSNEPPRYRQFAILGSEQPISSTWARYDFPVNDIPLSCKDQLRVKFHLTGDSELYLDDIQLCDLRFDEELRNLLVKQIFAAKTALDLGNVVDCMQVVDEYWSRYLVEYVPPREAVPSLNQEATPVNLAAKPVQPKKSSQTEEKKGLGERMRGWVPRIWR